MKPQCYYCHYCKFDLDDSYRCHRYPPKKYSYEDSPEFPQVSSDEWCGEFWIRHRVKDYPSGTLR